MDVLIWQRAHPDQEVLSCLLPVAGDAEGGHHERAGPVLRHAGARG